MPYPELKSEYYGNLGGINQKASLYQTGLNEVLRAVNMDLTRPGALTKRPGFTLMYAIGPTVDIFAVSGKGGSVPVGYTVVGQSLLAGITTTTIPFSQVTGVWNYVDNSSVSEIVASCGVTSIAYLSQDGSTVLGHTSGTGIFKLGLSSSGKINPSQIGYDVSQNNVFDFVNFVSRLFFANGNTFQKQNATGQFAYLYSLPPGPTLTGVGFSTSSTGPWFSPGIYQFAYGYQTSTGATGPASGDAYLGPAINTLSVSIGPSIVAINLNGFTSLFFDTNITGLTHPLGQGYDIANIHLYQSNVNQNALYGLNPPYAPGQTYLPNTATTMVVSAVSTLGTQQAPQYLWFTLAPRFLEVYNNQLFLAGFSSLPSDVYFSDIGVGEGVGATSFFEVRTNDGDRLTALKTYYSSLSIFKKNSFHQLLGTDPSNFQLNEISDQYGCLSNRAVCVYQDKLLFLDRNGIVEFNGANVGIISNRMEASFRRMNVNAAIDNAIMLHIEPRNEVWTCFPIDGATINNHAVVYDYVANGFYEVEGPQFSAFFLFNPGINYSPGGYGVNVTLMGPALPLYGDYSGQVHYMGSSQYGYFTADNGIGFSCVVQAPFRDGGLGYSPVKQFRRLFVDCDPGSSSILDINLRQDNGSSIVYSTTLGIGPFQNRIDFGVPAKSLSAEMGFYNASLMLRVNGWTYHSRFQRDR